MKGRLRWLTAVLLLSLPIFVIVLVVLRDFVRERIVVPVIYMLWVGGMIFNSIPQIFFLVGLVLIGLMLAVGSLRYLLTVVHLPSDPPAGIEEPTRYQFWRRRCSKINSSAFFLTSLGLELRRFVLMVLAYQEHRDMWDLEREIINQEYDVPPVIYDLIAQRELGVVPPERSLWQELLARLQGLYQPEVQPEHPLGSRLEHIITFLENRLEVKHDRRNP